MRLIYTVRILIFISCGLNLILADLFVYLSFADEYTQYSTSCISLPGEYNPLILKNTRFTNDTPTPFHGPSIMLIRGWMRPDTRLSPRSDGAATNGRGRTKAFTLSSSSGGGPRRRRGAKLRHSAREIPLSPLLCPDCLSGFGVNVPKPVIRCSLLWEIKEFVWQTWLDPVKVESDPRKEDSIPLLRLLTICIWNRAQNGA